MNPADATSDRQTHTVRLLTILAVSSCICAWTGKIEANEDRSSIGRGHQHQLLRVMA